MAGREKRFLKTEISDSWTGGESSLSRKSFLMGGGGGAWFLSKENNGARCQKQL